MKEVVRFEVNGRPVSLSVDPERMLLWVLRTELGLTGTKYGCGEGLCGACTVMIDGEPAKSCSTAMKAVRSRGIITIEGLASDGARHLIQEAFIRHNAMQCGFCTSGMIIAAYGLLRKNPRPTRQGIIQAMDDHLCRCGGYRRIIQAIETAAQEMKRGAQR